MGFQLLFVPRSGATTILVTAPKMCKRRREFIWFQLTHSCHQLLINLAPRDVTAPEVARGVPLQVYINV